jgi:dihydrofolate reductase
MISIVVATTENRVIGVDGQLPWGRLKSDMARVKSLTIGHPVIMGRSTYESIPEKFRPLPERTNIILTRDTSRTYAGCLMAHSLAEALQLAHSQTGNDEVFIFGGGQIYAQALPSVHRIYLTEVDVVHEGGTSFFPKLDSSRWEVREEGGFSRDEHHEHNGRFLVYNRTGKHPIVEPTNARNEIYRADLESIQNSGQCPFCPGGKTLREQKILRENNTWLLTKNYHPVSGSVHHFVLIPKRHVEKREELDTEEIQDLWEMQRWVESEYRSTGSVLYGRSGEPLVTGATVAHIHFQLVIPVGLVTVTFGPYPPSAATN